MPHVQANRRSHYSMHKKCSLSRGVKSVWKVCTQIFWATPLTLKISSVCVSVFKAIKNNPKETAEVAISIGVQATLVALRSREITIALLTDYYVRNSSVYLELIKPLNGKTWLESAAKLAMMIGVGFIAIKILDNELAQSVTATPTHKTPRAPTKQLFSSKIAWFKCDGQDNCEPVFEIVGKAGASFKTLHPDGSQSVTLIAPNGSVCVEIKTLNSSYTHRACARTVEKYNPSIKLFKQLWEENTTSREEVVFKPTTCFISPSKTDATFVEACFSDTLPYVKVTDVTEAYSSLYADVPLYKRKGIHVKL